MPAGGLGRCHFDRDKTGAAAHPGHVVGDAFAGDETFIVSKPRRHRRHDDAVFNLDRPDTGRRQQDVHEGWATEAILMTTGAEPLRPKPSALAAAGERSITKRFA